MLGFNRKTLRQVHEATLQYKLRHEAPPDLYFIEEKLTQLLTFIRELEQTPEGADELRCRLKAFGKCERSEGETSNAYYAKLRHWLDKDLPQTSRIGISPE